MKQTVRILGTRRRPALIRPALTLLRTGIWAGTLSCAVLLSGCGLKGPLYLPAPGPTPSTAASAPTP